MNKLQQSILMLAGLAFLFLPVLAFAEKSAVVPAAVAVQQEKTVDIGDGFLMRVHSDATLVKFPDQYLDSKDHFVAGIFVAANKVFGKRAAEAKIDIDSDEPAVLIAGPTGVRLQTRIKLLPVRCGDDLCGVAFSKR